MELEYALPIDNDWATTEIVWGVTPGCCDQPTTGPASPEGPIPTDGWPADGFYDVTVTRGSDAPGVLQLAIRRWVPCFELPERCTPGYPDDGIVADPDTEIARPVLMTDADLTVVIRPIQRVVEGRYPDPPVGITGSGSALYELLSGWCEGSLPPGSTINCGVDHAFVDWIWDPFQVGSSVMSISSVLVDHGADPSFPLGPFDDGSSDVPCSTDRPCPLAYRGPLGSHLVIHPGSAESTDGFPGYELYGWWTSLEVRAGRPILYIDAGQIAG
jgi:hypothetical protein